MEATSPTTMVFIDGSYFCFHRYFALKRWWHNAYPEEPLSTPSENERFVTKFRKTFVTKLDDLRRTNKVSRLFVGKDCPRAHIWRNELYGHYKATRTAVDDIGPFFRIAYDEGLFGDTSVVLSHPHLEADDCIALAVRQIFGTATNPNPNQNQKTQCIIYTGDCDYLQLRQWSPHLSILQLDGSELRDKSGFSDPAEQALFKVIAGDKSDNIPPVFPRCGTKTAQKYIRDKSAFTVKLDSDPAYRNQYEQNRSLILFECIPTALATQFCEMHFNVWTMA